MWFRFTNTTIRYNHILWPDKSGTDYLAALINEARDTLLAAHSDDASKPD